jgi:hypothetical protein
MFGSPKKTSDVFGISTEILPDSYVNRGKLDEELQRLLGRPTHIALRGESKCGKSWIRQRNIPDAITVQCRLNKKPRDLYADALSQLGLHLTTERRTGNTVSGKLEATGEAGFKLLAKVATTVGGEIEKSNGTTSVPVGQDLDDLRFVSTILNESGRRLVIEDFHYLSPAERKAFAFDLKALWDYKTYVIIIGIWAENNLLLHLNPDLSGRITELPIYWSGADLREVLSKGSNALKITFSEEITKALVDASFGTVGILQKLALGTLDAAGLYETQRHAAKLEKFDYFQSAAMEYAEQLNALYQTFAKRVAAGIRQRQNSTGIYAHMLKVVLAADDRTLSNGMHTDAIFLEAHKLEPRVQKPNLRQILLKIDAIQVDDDGRGLILSYDENKDEVCVVDRQLFLYRKYATVQWPWEQIIEEADASTSGYDTDPN